MSDFNRANTLLLSKSALAANVRSLTERAGAPICAVVKANAYGMGARDVAPIIEATGVAHLAVATLEEALVLREAGVVAPIMILGGSTWGRHPERLLAAPNLVPLIASVDEVNDLKRHLPADAHLTVHLAIDTGMSREGVYVGDDVGAAISAVKTALDAPGATLNVTGMMTHFANADLSDPDDMQRQVSRFAAALDAGAAVLKSVHIAHVSNSAATLAHGARFGALNDAAFDRFTFWGRPGFALYGTTPFPDGRLAEHLTPAYSWRAPIVGRKRVTAGTAVSYGSTFVCPRDTELAVLGLGYADGYHRAFSSTGVVRIGRRDAPVLGRVCMDLTIVDVTDHIAAGEADACALHAPAIVLGAGAALSPWDAAARANTIAYELMTSIAERVHRVVVEDFAS